MLKNIFLLLCATLLSVFLISCNSKQRTLAETEEVPTETPIETPTNTTADTDKSETPKLTNELVGPPAPKEVVPEEVVEEGPSFEADIKPHLATCTACHGTGVLNCPLIDWNNYADAKKYADNGELVKRIWDLKADPNKGMPVGGESAMDEETRLLIKSWAESGAKP